MSVKRPKATCNYQTQRKRTAREDLIDERVHKYLKSMSNADSVSIGLLDRSIDDGDKLAQARGGCIERKKSSKDPDTPDVTVGPLSEQALRQLNKMNRQSSSKARPSMTSRVSSALPNTSVLEEMKGTINPYNDGYLDALSERGIEFANNAGDKMPPNLGALKEALRKRRSDSGPNDTSARRLRTLMVDNANNERAMMLKILPTIVPVGALDADDATYTVPHQEWSCRIMVKPKLKPALADVKPDLTVGWSRAVFSHRKAMRHLGAHACPVVGCLMLSFPLFTVQVKGDGGSLRVARLQNLYNGAIMLSNLWRIRQFYTKEKEDELFNRVHALSLQLTPDIIQLSCYWAARGDNGQILFYGTEIGTWTPFVDRHFRTACNAMEWVKNQAFDWICSALATLEGNLNSPIPTPPITHSNKGKAKRTRSLTSESSPANPPSKKRPLKDSASKSHRASTSRKKRKRRSQKVPKSSSAGDQEAEMEQEYQRVRGRRRR